MLNNLYYIGLGALLISHIIKSIPNNIDKKYSDYLDLYGSTINIIYFYNKEKTYLTYINLSWYITSLISLLYKKNKNLKINYKKYI